MTNMTLGARGESGPQLYAIVPTQFRSNGTVDTAAIAGNVVRLADEGIVDFLVTGAYGEFQSLADGERAAIVRAVSGTGRARSLMAGAVTCATATTVDLA